MACLLCELCYMYFAITSVIYVLSCITVCFLWVNAIARYGEKIKVTEISIEMMRVHTIYIILLYHRVVDPAVRFGP